MRLLGSLTGILTGILLVLAWAAPRGIAQANALAALQSDPDLSVFAGLAQQAGMETVLQNAPALTVIAPTNEAFGRVPPDRLAALRDNADALRQFVGYAVVPRTVSPQEIAGAGEGLTLATRQGASLTLTALPVEAPPAPARSRR